MTPESTKDKAILDRLMKGAIDTHIHFGPESRLKRRQTAPELAKTAKEMGMGGIILKHREYGTAVIAQIVQDLVPEIKVFGSFTMDNEAGGLNPGAVLAWIKLGAKYIWFPTSTAANSKDKVKRSRGLDLPGDPLSIYDSKHKILPVVKEILQLIKEYDVIMGTGHVTPEEHFVLVEEAFKMGIKKVVITHVQQDQLSDKILTNEEIVKLADMGAMIEYSWWTCENNIIKTDPKILAESIKLVGAERCIMSTDFGQGDNPPAPEGFRNFMGAMLKNGIPEKDIEIMVKKNPAKILGLA